MKTKHSLNNIASGKHLLMLTVITLLLPVQTVMSQQTDNIAIEQSIQKGDQLFQSGNYQSAITCYEQVIAQGYHSSSLYYNLGNAYYRQENLGQAILNYKRALKLKPYDKETQENLALAEEKTSDHINMLPSEKFNHWLTNIVNLMGPTGWEIATLVSLLILSLSATLFFTSSKRSMKKYAFLCGIIITIVMVATSINLSKSITYANRHDELVVIRPEITVYGSPDNVSSAKFNLHEGTSARLEEQINNWYRIVLADGNKGWVNASDMAKI